MLSQKSINKNSIRIMFFNEKIKNKKGIVHGVSIKTDIIKVKIYFRMIETRACNDL